MKANKELFFCFVFMCDAYTLSHLIVQISKYMIILNNTYTLSHLAIDCDLVVADANNHVRYLFGSVYGTPRTHQSYFAALCHPNDGRWALVMEKGIDVISHMYLEADFSYHVFVGSLNV